MASFGGLILTSKGRALQAKAQAGASLIYTRIGMGDGNLGGQQIPNLTALISAKKYLTINRITAVADGKMTVSSYLSNTEITTGFFFRELGLFATDPDEGEILYCYGNAGAGAEYIPSGGGPDIVEKYINVVAIVGNAANVSAIIDHSLIFVEQQDFDSHRNAEVLNHPDNSVTDPKIGNRTADHNTSVAYGLTGRLTQWISWFAKYLKAITGKQNPFDTPDITLAATKVHVDDPTRHITAAERTSWNAKQAALGYTPENSANKGAAGGYAGLDSGAKIPTALLPDSIVGQVEYQGTWNATTNVPALPAATTVKGHYYVVATAGVYSGLDFQVGDWVISNGSAWQKVDNTDAVPTVFGRTGNVMAAANDYTWAQINKATSSLADISTRSAGDLSSGTLLAARLPAFTGDMTSSAGSVATTIAAGVVTDAKIGNRSILDTSAPTGDTATITTMFGWIAYMIKAITGGATWRTLPGMTIAAIKIILDAATDLATPSTMVKRDVNGDFTGRVVKSTMNLSENRFSRFMGNVGMPGFTSNQKINLQFSGSYTGYVDVTLTAKNVDGYSAGVLTKRFAIDNSASVGTPFFDRYTEVLGSFSELFAISSLSYDDATDKYIIVIAKRDGNVSSYTNLSIYVEGVAATGAAASIMINSLSLSAVYTTDTTAYPKAIYEFMSTVKFRPQFGAPFEVTSQTVVANLNADLFDGYHASNFSLNTDYVRQPGFGTLSGNGNYLLTITPPAPGYMDGMAVAFKVATTNATANPSLNVSGLGPRPLYDGDGTVLAAGALKANSIYTARYNLTTQVFYLQGKGGGTKGVKNVTGSNQGTVITNTTVEWRMSCSITVPLASTYANAQLMGLFVTLNSTYTYSFKTSVTGSVATLGMGASFLAPSSYRASIIQAPTASSGSSPLVGANLVNVAYDASTRVLSFDFFMIATNGATLDTRNAFSVDYSATFQEI
jgi:hypothetical protein